MAYSSIGHVGYALIGLACGTAQGISSLIIYLTIYLAMNIGVFAFILSMKNKGDYFEKHQDRNSQDDDRCLSGGIELSDESDFEGANYLLKRKPIEFERGKLFTHKLTDEHEITKTKKGTRWSLHFGINKQKEFL